jgi:hypothetical protein
MKDTLLTILTSLGVIAILGVATYFPYVVIYDFTLQQMFFSVFTEATIDPFAFRAKVTIGALVIAAIIVVVMVLLRKVSRVLDLKLFEKVLYGGVFYTVIATVLVLAGLWLDFRIGLPASNDHPSDFCRVGFLFYLTYIH